MENLRKLLLNKMERILLVTRPQYDGGTAYLSHYAKLVLEFAERRGIEKKDFPGKDANKKEVLKYVSKKNPKLIFVNGHGDEGALEGDKDEILFSVEDGLKLLRDKAVYARACHAGILFGPEMVKNNNGCFIGYISPFSFWIDEARSSTPLKDKTAALFLRPSNEIVNSLIAGRTAKEAYEFSKKKMIESMQKIFKMNQQNEPGAMGLLEILWTNYQGQVLYGNEEFVF